MIIAFINWYNWSLRSDTFSLFSFIHYCLTHSHFYSFTHSHVFCFLFISLTHLFNLITSAQFQLILFFFYYYNRFTLIAHFRDNKTHSLSLSLSLFLSLFLLLFLFFSLPLHSFSLTVSPDTKLIVETCCTDDSVSKEGLQINCLNNNNLNININAICHVNSYNSRHWAHALYSWFFPSALMSAATSIALINGISPSFPGLTS